MLSRIKERIGAHSARKVECAETIMAGVVIPLFEKDGDVFFVLTKRTDTVKIHKGEVSFPGGMYEPGDGNTKRTAMRECCEEIGVKNTDLEIIGQMDDVYTMTGFVITPYVGIIPYPYTFKTNPGEVAYLIYLPYGFLKKTDPAIEMAEHEGITQPVSSFHYNGDRIWGATCRMLVKFRDIVEHE
ncbi:MAG: CoA pyrophosphatase [Syntrophorhabdaceae bacterium]|jgi:8-oxo-dGTP pyrophosphatase MutT (NUDIX family)|nr:CoA pyrophosphatase [Syntrophorhabdaceae bacterium]